MTYQSNLQSSGFRELSPQELKVVSGGSRIAYAREDRAWRDRHSTGDNGFDATLGDPKYTVFGLGDGQQSGSGSGAGSAVSGNEVDGGEIIVEADRSRWQFDDPDFEIALGTRIVIGNDEFGYYQGNGIWRIDKESDWFWNLPGDGTIGFYRQVSPDEAALILGSSSETTVNGNGEAGQGGAKAGAGIEIKTNGNTTTYWVPAY